MGGEEEEFTMIRIQTHNIKVTMHCHACGQSLRRRVQPIEGVIDTNADLQRQILTVRGTVDSSVLLHKLSKTGKHPHLCPFRNNPRPNNQNPDPPQTPNSNNAVPPNSNPNPNPNRQNNNSNRTTIPNPNPLQNCNSNHNNIHNIPNPNNNTGKNRGKKNVTLDEILEEDEDSEDDWEDVPSEIQVERPQPPAPKNGNQNKGNNVDQKITMAELGTALKGKAQVDIPILGGKPIGMAGSDGGGSNGSSSSKEGGGGGGSTSRRGCIQIGGPNNAAKPYFEGSPNFMGGGGQMPPQISPSSVMMMGMNGNPHLRRCNPQAFQSGPPMLPSTHYHYQTSDYYNPYPDPFPAPAQYPYCNSGYYEYLPPPPSNSDDRSSTDTTGWCSIM